ncbi:MAG: tetratricopeptide repeat protein [Flavobacteriales bacterium]|nr:tetratricopeptide repeat protein [Flavobacteriales bacterium]
MRSVFTFSFLFLMLFSFAQEDERYSNFLDDHELFKLSEKEQRIYLQKLDSILNSGKGTADEFYLRGLFRSKSGDKEGAIKDYTHAIQLDPKLYAPYVNRGLLYAEKADTARALADYTMAIKLEPNHPSAYNNRGYLNQLKGNYPTAIADYDKAISLDNKFSVSYINKLRTFMQMGKEKEAEEVLIAFTKIFPDDPRTYTERADFYEQQNNYIMALKELDLAVEKSKNDPAFIVYRSNFKDDVINDDEGALADCNLALSMEPNNPKFHYAKSRPLYDMGKYREVYESCTKALEIDPNYYDALTMRGNVLDYMGMWQQALRDYEAAIKIRPDEIYAYRQIAILYNNRKEFDKSAAAISAYLNRNPENSLMLIERSKINFSNKGFQHIVNDMNTVLRLEPKNGFAYLIRAVAFDSLGKVDLACKDAQMAQQLGIAEGYEYLKSHCRDRINPKILKAEELMDKAGKKQIEGQYKEALVLMDEAVKTLPDSGYVWYARAKIKRSMEDYSGSIPDLKKAIELKSPLLEEVWVTLGVAYQRTENNTEARKCYDQAIRVNPKYAMAYYNIGLMYYFENDYQECVRWVNRALGFNPQYLLAYQLLAECGFKLNKKEWICGGLKGASDLGDMRSSVKLLEYCD